MTLRHVVMWKLASEDESERAEQARKVTHDLVALKGVVPAIQEISSGIDVVGGNNWDVALVVDVADAAALKEYHEHPEHQKVLVYGRSIFSSRVAVDYEV